MKLLIAAAALLALQDDKVDLRWKFQKGQEIRYRITQKTAVDSAAVILEQEMKTTYSQTVTGVEGDGTATLLVKYEAVAMKSTGPMEYDYDSERDKEPPDHPAIQPISRLVGQSFTLKMGPTGKVSEVKGFDRILDALFKTDEDNPQAAMMKQMLKQSYSDEAMQSMMQQMYMPLPPGPVTKADTWKSDLTLQVPMVGKTKLTGTARLVDVKGGDAHLEQDWKLEVKDDGGEGKDPLAAMVKITSMKGKSTGVFSPERGLFLSTRADSTSVMTVAGQEMEVRSVNETRLLEKKAGDKKDY